MKTMLRLPKDSLLFYVGAEGVVLQTKNQKLFALNTFSTYLWSCLDINPSVEQAVIDAVQQFGLSAALASEYALQAIEQWHDVGLLEPQYEVPEQSTSYQALTEVSGINPLEPPPSAPSMNVRLLDHTVSIFVDDETALSAIRAVIGHLEVSIGQAPQPEGRTSVIDVRRGTDSCIVYRNSVPVARFKNPDSIAPTVKSVMLQEAIDHFDYMFYFHAGVLSNGNALVMLPGAQGAGKSTLTAGLVAAGFTYYSDEVALVNRDDGLIRPFPIALCSKAPAWPILAGLFPEFDTLPSFPRLDDKVVRYRPPEVDLLDPAYNRPLPVKYLVFPTYSPDATTGLIPLGKVTALQQLMTECLAMKSALTVEMTAWLVEWIEGVDCYELPNASLKEAVTAVTALVTE
jgi:hypothetical protein